MLEHKLKLNPGKTELIVFGSMDKFKWLKDSFPVNILGNCISHKDVVRNLGVLFDCKFSFTNHVNSVIKSSFANLRDLHHIRRFLSHDVSIMVANVLENIQNCLARFVSGVSRFSHVSAVLKSLHWLLVSFHNVSFSKPCYSHKSSLLLESQNNLSHICLYIHLLLRQGVVIQIRCSSNSPFTVPQFINLRFISINLFHMMLQNSGMICHWKFKLLQHYHVSKHNLNLPVSEVLPP